MTCETSSNNDSSCKIQKKLHREYSLPTKTLREECYEAYCSHLAKGKSKRSFVFKKGKYSCTANTVENYLNRFKELDPVKKEIALCEGFAVWEQIVEDSATGVNKYANTATLQMVMRNKFGWDKVEEPQQKNVQVEFALSKLEKIKTSDC